MRQAKTKTSRSKPGDNADPLFDAKAAGRYLGLTGVVKHPEQAVRSLARKRRIRATVVAGHLMFRQSWLETYLAENTRTATA